MGILYFILRPILHKKTLDHKHMLSKIFRKFIINQPK